MKIIRKWPYALKIETLKKPLVVYFDNESKYEKWKTTLLSLIDLNTKKTIVRTRNRAKS
jgi:hypothetical protein